LNVRLEKLTADEVRQLADLVATSQEGRRVRVRVNELVAAQQVERSGRWPLLMWFARQERIMSRAELGAALSRRQAEGDRCASSSLT
jgi:hypothetical protein